MKFRRLAHRMWASLLVLAMVISMVPTSFAVTYSSSNGVSSGRPDKIWMEDFTAVNYFDGTNYVKKMSTENPYFKDNFDLWVYDFTVKGDDGNMYDAYCVTPGALIGKSATLGWWNYRTDDSGAETGYVGDTWAQVPAMPILDVLEYCASSHGGDWLSSSAWHGYYQGVYVAWSKLIVWMMSEGMKFAGTSLPEGLLNSDFSDCIMTKEEYNAKYATEMEATYGPFTNVYDTGVGSWVGTWDGKSQSSKYAEYEDGIDNWGDWSKRLVIDRDNEQYQLVLSAFDDALNNAEETAAGPDDGDYTWAETHLINLLLTWYTGYSVSDTGVVTNYDFEEKDWHIYEPPNKNYSYQALLIGVDKTVSVDGYLMAEKKNPDGNPLEGILFGLYDTADAPANSPIQRGVTDSAGQVSFTVKQPDDGSATANYWIAELPGQNRADVIPNTQKSDMIMVDFAINSSSAMPATATWTIGGVNYDHLPNETPVTAYVKLNKEVLSTDASGVTTSAPGVGRIFGIWAADNPVDMHSSGTVGANGELILTVNLSEHNDIDFREFVVQELLHIDDTIGWGTKYSVLVNFTENTSPSNPALVQGDNGSTIYNRDIDTGTSIVKISGNTGELLPNAQFEIYGSMFDAPILTAYDYSGLPVSGERWGDTKTISYPSGVVAGGDRPIAVDPDWSAVSYSGYFSKTVVTDANGEYKFQWHSPDEPNYIPPGYYTIRETNPPAGYNGSDVEQYMTLWLTSTAVAETIAATDSTKIDFTPQYGDPLNPATPTGISSATVSSFNVETVVSGSGYSFANVAGVGIGSTSNYLMHWVNWEKKPVHIKKVSIDEYGNQTTLAGAEFDIYHNDVFYGTGVTGTDGIMTVPEASSGVWKFVETRAPAGYVIPYDNVSIVMVPEHAYEDIEFTIVNAEVPEIVIKKLGDAWSAFGDYYEKGLPGAKFEIKIDDGASFYAVTNGDGEIVLNYETYGNYMSGNTSQWKVSVREVTAPSGYVIDNPEWVHAYLKNGESFDYDNNPFEFKNTPYPFLRVEKEDRDTGAKLSGMKFTVSIDGVPLGQTFTTGVSGSYTLAYEELGRFLDETKTSWFVEVTEIEAPEGYQLDLQENNTYTITDTMVAGETLTMTFKDTQNRRLEVIKKDSINGELIAGAEFTLTSTDGTSVTKTSMENGVATFIDLDYGNYVLSETKPPIGYSSSDVTHAIAVTKDSPNVIEIEYENDTLIDIVIYKTDGVYRNPIEGVTFLIECVNNGVLVGTWTETTNAAGEIHMTNMPTGYYTVKELDSHDDYINGNEIQERLVEVTHEVVPFYFENDEYPSIIILKVDADTNEPLAGAYFSVNIEGVDFGVVGPSGEDGLVVIGSDTYGKFLDESSNEKNQWTVKVKEIIAPAGYLIDFTGTVTYEVIRGQSAVPIVFTDTKEPELIILKVDADTQEPLAGAVFEVTIEGTYLGRFTSDSDGYISIDASLYGDLLSADTVPWSIKVEEIKPPAGYNQYYVGGQRYQEQRVYTTSKIVPFIFENTPYTGLRIIKTDADTGVRLKDATFTLKGTSNAGEEINMRLTTDENGEAFIEGLPNGHYSITEVESPDGYWLEWFGHTVTITDDSPDIIDMTVTNQAIGGLLLLKLDATTKQGVPGVTFKIDYTGIWGNESWELTTDSTGQIYVKDSRVGDYVITEIKAADGYILNSEPVEFTVTHDLYERTIILENEQERMLNIQKIDAVTGKVIPGTTFSITKTSGEFVANITTGTNGYASLGGLGYGDYVAKEISAAPGYVLGDETQYFSVIEGDETQIINLVFENKNYPKLQIQKIDEKTLAPLAGAVFNIYTSDNEVVVEGLVSDATGLAMFDFDGWPAGNYWVEEVSAPNGYQVSTDKHWVYLESGKTSTITVKNALLGSLNILKTNAGRTVALEGAVFEIFAPNGDTMGQFTTDADGYIHLDGLVAGYYLIREISAPAGYLSNSTNQFVWVENYKNTSMVITNDEAPGLTIKKVDAKTNETISGVWFEIKNVETEKTDYKRTDEFGLIYMSSLEAGTYIITEKSTTEGYILDETPKTVTISNNGSTVVVFVNHPKEPIIIKKIDGETGLPLAGAFFVVHGVGAYWTDETGTIITDTVYPGEYLVEEGGAPAGYMISSEPVMVTAEPGKSPIVYFENFKAPTINIYKTDYTTGLPVEGATFALKDWTNQIMALEKTDINGFLSFSNLSPGTYTAFEQFAPTGYILDQTEYAVVIGENDTANKNLYITNKTYGTITVQKIDAVTGEPVQGATFALRADCDGAGAYAMTTDENGLATVTIKTPGTYLMYEVNAPTGYIKLDTTWPVTVRGGEDTFLTIENEPYNTLTLRKVDATTNEPIAGAIFKVETIDNSLVGMFMTDLQGECLVSNIAAGVYLVTEVIAPAGYEVIEEPKVVVVENGKNNYVEFADKAYGTLVITLHDMITNEPIENGQFVVSDSNGTYLFTGYTDITGTLMAGLMPAGDYKVMQVTISEEWDFSFQEDFATVYPGQQTTVPFLNQTSGMVIQLINYLTDEPIEGGRFEVMRESDNAIIGQYVTDQDGQILLSGLNAGFYKVTQMSTPDGYFMDSYEHQVWVQSNKEARLTVYNRPATGLTIKAINALTGEGVEYIWFSVEDERGVSHTINTTDTTGSYYMPNLEAGDFNVVLNMNNNLNYTAEITEKQITKVDGEPLTVVFEVYPNGVLIVKSVDTAGKALSDMSFTVSGGDIVYDHFEYRTDESGVWSTNTIGHGNFIVTEVKAPEGYLVPSENQYPVVVEYGNVTEVTFVHEAVYGLQIQNLSFTMEDRVVGVTYDVHDMTGVLVGQGTSNYMGVATIPLDPGFYLVTQTSVPEGFVLDTSDPMLVEVVADEITIVKNLIKEECSIYIRMVDGETRQGIYGVNVILYKDDIAVGLYTSDQDGFIDVTADCFIGNYKMEMFTAPAPYSTDRDLKSFRVVNGGSIDVEWTMWADATQVQVKVVSNDYNTVLHTEAGTPLAGAVFSIMDADTYQPMGFMVSDTMGIAASNSLPIGRYIVTEVCPAPYYLADRKEYEVRLKVTNDVVQLNHKSNSVYLETMAEIQSNVSVTAGESMRVDMKNVGNNSTQTSALTNFFVHIKIPTDAARAGAFSTGVWSSYTTYDLSYKTNMNDYRVLLNNVGSTNSYMVDFSTVSLGLMAGEYVTDIRYEFAFAPSVFRVVELGQFMLYPLSTVTDGYRMEIRIECGGLYTTPVLDSMTHMMSASSTWVTQAGQWFTTIDSTNKIPTTLPTTGW